MSRQDEDVLRPRLQELISHRCGRPAAVVEIDRRRSDYSSSYDSEVLTVRLDTGEELRLFLKNLGDSRFPKDNAGQRRERERGVYQMLLADTDLGTPRYYGSVWDKSQGTFWLLLEFVGGAEVRHCALEYWVAAAGWLGRLRGHFALRAARLQGCDFLVRHDADFFRARAESAVRDVYDISVPLGRRLAGILGEYDQLVDVMAAQPRTLVHGHYRPCNILVDVHAEPVRICPVDWEQAAYGSALYDLALLCDGFEPPELDRFLEAYRREAGRHGVAVPDGEGLRQMVGCFGFFLTINRLSRARERQFAEPKVAKTVDLLGEIRQRIFAGRAGV